MVEDYSVSFRMVDGVILDTYWITGWLGAYCAVAVGNKEDQKKWKAYLGHASSGVVGSDEERIANLGAPLPKKLACAFFPNLDPKGWQA